MKNAPKFLRLSALLRPLMSIRGWYFRIAPWSITCREFNDSIYDYQEGDLSGPSLTAFERHKRTCPICRNFLKTYAATQKAAEHITPHADLVIEDGIPQDFVQALLDAKRERGE